MSPSQSPVGPGGPTPYEQVQAGPEFQALRRSLRRFVFPMTLAFLVWYFLYVVLAAFATDFFTTIVVGNINVGLLFGLGQFLSTAIITVAYVWWADRHLDEPAAKLRDEVEALKQEQAQTEDRAQAQAHSTAEVTR